MRSSVVQRPALPLIHHEWPRSRGLITPYMVNKPLTCAGRCVMFKQRPCLYNYSATGLLTACRIREREREKNDNIFVKEKKDEQRNSFGHQTSFLSFLEAAIERDLISCRLSCRGSVIFRRGVLCASFCRFVKLCLRWKLCCINIQCPRLPLAG